MSAAVGTGDLDAMLKRLHLPTIRRLYAELALRAEADGMSYRDFLETLAAEEIAHRAQTRITRSVRRARFPYLRTIEEFDFTFQTSVRMQMLGTLLGPELVSEGRSAIFSGPPGRGKTHLAVAVAYRAIQNGFEAFFTSADELIGALSHAALAGRLEAALEPYVHPHVLVIDELGYQSYAADAANVLFRVVSIRHLKRRSTSSRRTSLWRRSGRCCMIQISPRPSATGSWSAVPTTRSAAAPTAPATTGRNSRKTPSRMQLDSPGAPGFREERRQISENPHGRQA